MPKLRPGSRRPPKGFDVIEAELDRFEAAMKDAVNAPHTSKRIVETTWEVARINFERTRSIWNHLRKCEISQEVFDFCASNRFVDGALAAKWKLHGYERLCCAQCVNPSNFSFGGSCICRVPSSERRTKDIECSTCGCTGCASGGDAVPIIQGGGEKEIVMEHQRETIDANDASGKEDSQNCLPPHSQEEPTAAVNPTGKPADDEVDKKAEHHN